MKTICIIQARFNATRLPGKVLEEVSGMPLLEYEINRIKQAKKIDKIVVATTINDADDKIIELCKKIGVDYFRGSEADVLNRHYECSQKYPEYNIIVRITGDCPLIDPKVIDQVINFFEQGNYDYASNVAPPTYPDGMDVEVFTAAALDKAQKNANLASHREHVTVYIREDESNKIGNFEAEVDHSKYRLALDNPEDFEVIKFLIQNSKITDSYLDYISLLEKNPNILSINSSISRNEGLKKFFVNDYIIKKKEN